MKKGQVTVFVILGIIILAVTTAFWYVRTIQPLPEAPILNVESIKMFVERCLGRTAKEAILFTSAQGGYYRLPGEFLEYSSFSIPYYFYQEEESIPEKEVILREMSFYIEAELPRCLNFSVFEDQGYHFEKGEISVISALTRERVLFDLNYPLVVTKGSAAVTLSAFSQVVEFDFNTIYEIITQLKIGQERSPNAIPLASFLEFGKKYGFTFEMAHFPEGIILYSLAFNYTILPDRFYLFSFAAQYNWSNLTPAVEEEAEKPFEESLLQAPLILKQKEQRINLLSNGEESAALPATPPVDWSTAENMEPAVFQNNFAADPAGAFRSSPDQAWQLLESDPTLLRDPVVARTVFARGDFRRALNIIEENSYLMEDKGVVVAVSEKAEGDIAVLNDHPNLKREWFNHYGIVDEGVELKGYDGLNVVTRGKPDELSTIFRPSELAGSRVLATGELVDKEGAKISGATVTVGDEGRVVVAGGRLDLSDNKKGVYSSRDAGKIVFNGKTFQPGSSISPYLDADFLTGDLLVAGENIVINKITNGKEDLYARVVGFGTVGINKKNFLVFYDNTRFEFPSAKSHHLIRVDVRYPITFGTCQGSGSCIEELRLSPSKAEGEAAAEGRGADDFVLRLRATEYNLLAVKAHENDYDRIEVEGISENDAGEVDLLLTKKNNNLALAKFKPGNQMELSNVGGLKTDLRLNYEESGEPHYRELSHGIVTVCSNCQKLGEIPDLPGNIPFRFDSPFVTVGSHQLRANLNYRPMLNGEWYGLMIPEAVEKGIDPYWFMAMHIFEIGGVRSAGYEQKLSQDRVSQDLAHFSIGMGFVEENGAGGVLSGDFQNAVRNDNFYPAEVESFVREVNTLGSFAEYNPETRELQIYFPEGDEHSAWDPESNLNQASLALLKTHQERTLREGGSQGIVLGLQSFLGYGELPKLFDENGRLVDYDPKKDTIAPSLQWSRGIKGRDHPLYGIAAAELIRQLASDPRIQQLIPKGARTPVLDQIRGRDKNKPLAGKEEPKDGSPS